MKTNNIFINSIRKLFGWIFGRRERRSKIEKPSNIVMKIEDKSQSAFHPQFHASNAQFAHCTPEFHPRRTKFKGWMRENRRSTFNKNR